MPIRVVFKSRVLKCRQEEGTLPVGVWGNQGGFTLTRWKTYNYQSNVHLVFIQTCPLSQKNMNIEMCSHSKHCIALPWKGVMEALHVMYFIEFNIITFQFSLNCIWESFMHCWQKTYLYLLYLLFYYFLSLWIISLSFFFYCIYLNVMS